jgi:hypothetical protein
MAFNNLPGVFPEKQDGGLAILASTNAPRVLVQTKEMLMHRFKLDGHKKQQVPLVLLAP